MGTIRMSMTVLIMMALAQFFACGGSKETARFEPSPFSEPEVTEEEAPPAKEVEPESKPEEDIVPKQPIRLATIYFDFDRANLTEEAQATLAENARQLQQHPEVNIRIEGHCDERGTVEYNLALGERRAIAAREYLVNFGISPRRITVISYGKERPVDPRHTPDAWAKNRRAEFVILNR